MTTLSDLIDCLPGLLGDALISQSMYLGEVTCEIDPGQIITVCEKLRDDPGTHFELLIDLCGMDYSAWADEDAGLETVGLESAGLASTGTEKDRPWLESRFAVVYHLLSLQNNQRLRLRVSLDDSPPLLDSVIEVWPAADWYEREAFDLFGIIFQGHPDLRRVLTDYGFIGHPLRKDFPQSGQVEMRYDEEQGRVIYQPVTIEPRILVPRTISKNVFSSNVDSIENTSESPGDGPVDGKRA